MSHLFVRDTCRRFLSGLLNRAGRVGLVILLLVASLSTVVQAAPVASRAFTAKMVQTRTLPQFDQPIVSQGMLHFDPDKGLRWEIDKPYHYVFQMKRDQASEILPDGTRRDLDPDKAPWLKPIEHIFSGALSGNNTALERYFDVTIKPAVQGQHRQLQLQPKSATMAEVITRIDVTEASLGQPQSIRIKEASGGVLDIHFTPVDGSTD